MMQQKFDVIQSPNQQQTRVVVVQQSTPRSSTRLLIFSFLMYLPFIVCDLYFGYSNNYFCTYLIPNTVSFDLGTWLLVDGYGRLTILILTIVWILLVIVCASSDSAGGILCGSGCYLLMIVLYGLFNFAWTIVGAVMFWGAIAPSGLCEIGVVIYMYILLIWSFIGMFFSACCNRRGNQEFEASNF